MFRGKDTSELSIVEEVMQFVAREIHLLDRGLAVTLGLFGGNDTEMKVIM
jgi:hypothetical protein